MHEEVSFRFGVGYLLSLSPRDEVCHWFETLTDVAPSRIQQRRARSRWIQKKKDKNQSQNVYSEITKKNISYRHLFCTCHCVHMTLIFKLIYTLYAEIHNITPRTQIERKSEI